jgi:hypothetical protein
MGTSNGPVLQRRLETFLGKGIAADDRIAVSNRDEEDERPQERSEHSKNRVSVALDWLLSITCEVAWLVVCSLDVPSLTKPPSFQNLPHCLPSITLVLLRLVARAAPFFLKSFLFVALWALKLLVQLAHRLSFFSCVEGTEA